MEHFARVACVFLSLSLFSVVCVDKNVLNICHEHRNDEKRPSGVVVVVCVCVRCC